MTHGTAERRKANLIKKMTIEKFRQVMEYLRKIIKGTEFEGHVFAVGGCVRDRRLGHEIKDIDLVVDLLNGGIVFAKHLQTNGFTEGSVVVYENYGTAMVRLKEFPDIELEFVQTRKEDYHDAKTRNPDTCFGTIEDDCQRRDFTINALYYNISEEKEEDFTGRGLADLEKGIIDTCGDPDIIFNEDPLRILRAIRFSARLGYILTERTREGIRRNAYRLDIISQERITDEFNKILSGPSPEGGMVMLGYYGLLPYVLPELKAADVSGEMISDMKKIRLAAQEEKKDQLLLELSYLSHIIRPGIFKVAMLHMKYSNEMINKVYLYAIMYENADFVNRNRSTPNLRQLEYELGTKEDYEAVYTMLKALSENIWFRMAPNEEHIMFGYTLPVDGNDVMETLGIGPGPKIGEVLTDITYDAFVNPNITREECIDLIKLRFANK